MRVLAIDTSSVRSTAGVATVSATVPAAAGAAAGSAAGSAAGTVSDVHVRSADDGRAHGELLAGLVAAALAAARLTPRDLDAVVVGAGPGPFTGLRVGIVTAATMASLLEIPLYGVGSLDAIAADVAVRPLLVVADARRKEVYWARYDDSGPSGPQVDRPADVPPAAAVTGAGVALYPDVFGSSVGVDHPSVGGLLACATQRLLQGAPTETVEPLYLRRPDAVVPGGRKTTVQR